MSNKAIVIGQGFAESDGRAQDAHIMADLAIGMGYDTTPIISSDDYSVSKAEFLDALTTLVTEAKPGDNLLFSFSGLANQTTTDHAGTWEADGKTELIQLADGAISDDDILAVLKQLPQGANLTVAMDCANAAGVADLDLGQYVPGNVVFLSSTAENQTDYNSDVSFPQLLSQVVQENPGITWAEAMAKVDGMNGDLACNVTANDANLLTQPAFGTTDDGAAAADDALVSRALTDTVDDGTFLPGVPAPTQQEVTHYTETTELPNGNTVVAQVFDNGETVVTTHTTYDACGNEIDYSHESAPSVPQTYPAPEVAVCDLTAAQQEVAAAVVVDSGCEPVPAPCVEEPSCC